MSFQICVYPGESAAKIHTEPTTDHALGFESSGVVRPPQPEPLR